MKKILVMLFILLFIQQTVEAEDFIKIGSGYCKKDKIDLVTITKERNRNVFVGWYEYCVCVKTIDSSECQVMNCYESKKAAIRKVESVMKQIKGVKK